MAKTPTTFFGSLLQIAGALGILTGIAVGFIVGLLVFLALFDPNAHPERWKREVEAALTSEAIQSSFESAVSNPEIRSFATSVGSVVLVLVGIIGCIVLLARRRAGRMRKIDALAAQWKEACDRVSSVKDGGQRTEAVRERESVL